MIEKRFPLVYSVLVSFFISITTILMILLFIEYRFFCKQAYELSSIKQQYSYYIDLLQRKINGDIIEADEIKEDDISTSFASDDVMDEMAEESSLILDEIVAAESSDAPDNDDEYADDSFVVINRHPDYLKKSTFDYMESQELNALMTAIDIDRWSDYTESFTPPAQTVTQNNKTTTKKKPVATISKVAIPQTQTIIKNNAPVRRSIKECGFIWPIDTDKFWLSSLFGPRKRVDGSWGFHHGIDMAAVKGTIIHAVKAGTVVEASFQKGYGNTVVIKHADNIKTRYAHLNAIRTYVGQKVKQGTVIGTVGETGFIRKKGKDGSHLHFEVYEQGKRINPLHCLPRMT
jgi:murein DD-endopeptidase MepM/ murein hydrolase activator NlpD